MSLGNIHIQRKAVIIPGAQKSGTTTLFELLSSHSSVVRPRVKEPSFFAFGQEMVTKHYESYLNLFDTARGSILLDASTFYLPSHTAPGYIKEFFEDPRLIILLRDPAKRAFSGYLHTIKKVPVVEKRDFCDILNGIECGSAEAIISSENRMVENAVKNNLVVDFVFEGYFVWLKSPDFRPSIEDNLWLFKYFQQSIYSRQVARFTEIFQGNVKVIFFEMLIAQPAKVIRELCEFIGIEPEEQMFSLRHVNRSRIPKSRTGAFLRKVRSKSQTTNRLVESCRNFLPNHVQTNIGNRLYSSPRMTEQQYFKAREKLASEYEYWFKLYPHLREMWKYK